MKFGKELKVRSVAEWREQYMSYKRLKRVIGKLAVQMKEQKEQEEREEKQQADWEDTGLVAVSRPAVTERLPLLQRQGSATGTGALLQRRLSKVYGTSELPASELDVSETEQREMIAGDARREFTAIIDNDIDRVNRHFREKIADYKAQYQRVYEQVRDTAQEDSKQREREAGRAAAAAAADDADGDRRSNGSGHRGGGSSVVVDVSHEPTVGSRNNRSDGNSGAALQRPASPLSLSPLTPPPVLQRPSISVSHARQLEQHSVRLLSLYRECCQLESYSRLNHDGFRKIMKKYDKQTGEDGHQEEMIARLQQEPFMAGLQELEELQRKEEKLFDKITIARGGELKEARGKLKLIRAEVEQPPEQDEGEHSSIRPHYVLLALTVYFLLLFIPILPPEQERAQRCAALLSLITILWVTEAIPFFVSALCIPFLVIVNSILADDTGQPLSAEKASKAAFGSMFNDTIMLILGGFSISTAFSKCGFELRLAAVIQRQLGHRPILFLLAFMALGAFLSMWISNVAAPVLLTSLLLPIVHDFGSGSADDRLYAKALLLGLAFSCNIGGMMSPISSPQNAVALGFLEQQAPEHAISFGQWLSVSVPFCALGLLLAWLWLWRVYIGTAVDIPSIPPIVYDKRPLTRTDWSVIVVSLLTIALWCSLTYTRPVLGEMGTVAVIPMVLFFGTGFLSKTDLFTFKWDLILLVGGGSVLGSAVNSSRLLHIISEWIKPQLEGRPLVLSVFAVLFLVFLITTFVSHTVAALILAPLIIRIGASAGHTQLLTMSATLMMSGTMSLPTSSFPNINSLSQEDDFGRAFLHSGDFLVHGSAVAAMLWALLNVFTVTYMQLIFPPDAAAAAAGS